MIHALFASSKNGGGLRNALVSGKTAGRSDDYQSGTKLPHSKGSAGLIIIGNSIILRLPDRLPAIAPSKTRNPAAPPPECFLPARLWSLREFRIRGEVRSGLENSHLAAP